MDDAVNAKARHDLRDWIVADLGQPAEQRSEYSKWCCPFHDEKEGSFTVWRENYHCFGCDEHGDIIDWVKARRRMGTREAIDLLLGGTTPQPSQLRSVATKHERIATKKEKQARKLLTEAKWHREYAGALLEKASAIEYLDQRGIPEAVAIYHGLGYRQRSPWGPAISIPWMIGDDLRGIQYRIIGGTGNQRYRWDERGHGNVTIYNADIVKGDKRPLWIVEGAFKALVLITHGLQAIALVNKTGWDSGWSSHLRHRPVFVCLDPDARAQAEVVVADIGCTARLVDLPRKPDDLIVEWDWTPEALNEFARLGTVA